MVGDDDARVLLAHVGKARADLRHLLLVDAAILERQRARRVHAQHGDLVVGIERRQVVGDIAPVARERLREAAEYIVERDVVVARHDDLGAGQGVEPGARGDELGALGALAQVARNDDEVGAERLHLRAQGRKQRRVDAAEMQVGQMNYGAHGILLKRVR